MKKAFGIVASVSMILVILGFAKSGTAEKQVAAEVTPEYASETVKKELNGKIKASDINRIQNKVFVIRDVCEIPKEGIVLGMNSSLHFVDGGKLKNGIVTLQGSNTIFSDGDLPCFENVEFIGNYNKPFKLSWIGVTGDGQDKSSILKKLTSIFPYGIQNLVIEGRIVCTQNEINVPIETELTGNGRTVLLFTSDMGDYCMSLSEGCSMHNITVANNNDEFTGAILLCSNEIVDNKPDGDSRLKGCANILLDDIKIKGANDAKGNSHSTGFKVLARRYDDSKTSNMQHLKHRYDFFSNIVLDNVFIRGVRYGVFAEVDNQTNPASQGNKHIAWGNEINSTLLYVRSSDSGVLFKVKGDNRYTGSCKFNNYTYQANYYDRKQKEYELKAFEVDNVAYPIMFSLLKAWDCEDEAIGDIKNGSVVYIDNDGFTNSPNLGSKSNHKRLTVAKNRYYRVFSGSLERKSVSYTR